MRQETVFFFFFLIAHKPAVHLKPLQRRLLACVRKCCACGCAVRLSGFRSSSRVPRQGPLVWVGNIHQRDLLSQLGFETRSKGRQRNYAGESQLPGEDKANMVFPRERPCPEEPCTPAFRETQIQEGRQKQRSPRTKDGTFPHTFRVPVNVQQPGPTAGFKEGLA